MDKDTCGDILSDAVDTIRTSIPRVEGMRILSERQRERVIKQLQEAMDNLNEVIENLKIENRKMAEFILKLAKEVKLNSNDKKVEKMGVRMYLRSVQKLRKYSKAARYDFDPELLKKLKRVYKEYLFGMIAFFVLSGMFMVRFLAITALILAIPIILAMLSLQRRGSMGLLLAFTSIPIPAIEGAMVITYTISTLRNAREVQKVASIMGKSYSFAQYYLVALLILGFIEFYLVMDSGIRLYQHRDAFL